MLKCNPIDCPLLLLVLPYNIFTPDAKFNEQSKLHVKSLSTTIRASIMLAVVWTVTGPPSYNAAI